MSRFTRTGWRETPLPPSSRALLPSTKCYMKRIPDGVLTVLVGPEPDGFHLSISHRVQQDTGEMVPGRYPTWDEIKEARYEFCSKAMTMAMIFPPKEEFVNFHPTTFHLWELPQ